MSSNLQKRSQVIHVPLSLFSSLQRVRTVRPASKHTGALTVACRISKIRQRMPIQSHETAHSQLSRNYVQFYPIISAVSLQISGRVLKTAIIGSDAQGASIFSMPQG